MLTFQPPFVSMVAVSSLWNKDVPLKVVLFAWRMFRDRLPTKDNLLRRGVIPGCVLLAVGPKRLRHIYFYIVIYLVRFGTISLGGWVCRR